MIEEEMKDEIFPIACASLSKARSEDPIGTASSFDHCVVVECPPPWHSDIVQSLNFPKGVLQVAQKHEFGRKGVRILGVIPDPHYSESEKAWVSIFSRPRCSSAIYNVTKMLIPRDEVAERIDKYFVRGADVETPSRSDMSPDLFVCTHGNHDACCGRFGYPIFEQLRYKAKKRRSSVRVWRVSHIGGHRFSPTLIRFPDGRFWGPFQPDMLDVIMDYEGSLDSILPAYRGWSFLSRGEQIIEREIFRHEGWLWLKFYLLSHSTRVIDEDGRMRVSIIARKNDDDHAVEYLGEIEPVVFLTKGSCSDRREKAFPKYVVKRLEKRIFAPTYM